MQIEEFIGREITWDIVRTRELEYNLYFNDKVVANVAWPKIFGSLTIVRFDNIEWQIQSKGKIFPRECIVTQNNTEFARIKFGKDHFIHLQDGGRFFWKHNGWWQVEGALFNQAEEKIINLYYQKISFLKAGKIFFIEPAIRNYREHSKSLIILCAYMANLFEQNLISKIVIAM